MRLPRIQLLVHGSADFDGSDFGQQWQKFRDSLPDQGAWSGAVHIHVAHKHRARTALVQWAGRSLSTTHMGRTADLLRDKLVDVSTHALFFWDGKSAGTAKLIDMVEEKGIPFRIVFI
jgi:hypothetical protein